MATAIFHALPRELQELQERIEEDARAYGLDFYPTIFELVDADQLNAVAAGGGFPTRYPHWRFGMEYERLTKGYSYGLQKIYELVINNDPCYAYLMRCNSRTDQKLVMAHVYGHCDFFKCNAWFSQTNRKMMDEMANHGNRIRRHMDRHGVEVVEEFIDVCLSIEDLIDIHSPFVKRYENQDPDYSFAPEEEDAIEAGRFRAKSYMERFVNPPAVLAAEKEKRIAEKAQESRFPSQPCRDVMLFLLEHAPLRPWQLDVLSIIRDEAYYFAPQGQTKIMNEGWASYWHSTIMTQKQLLPDEIIHYCDHHSGTMGGGSRQLNPYKLGIELFRDIEDRWNKGRFGKDYDDCEDLVAKKAWNTEAGGGREKIFEVRRIYNDLTFIDTFLTHEFCREHKLFQFGYNDSQEVYEIESREFPKVKQQLLFSLTNMGRPIISVVDANYKNRGELFLNHESSGVDIQVDYALDTLRNLHAIWTRPVHVETRLNEKRTILSFDGNEASVNEEE